MPFSKDIVVAEHPAAKAAAKGNESRREMARREREEMAIALEVNAVIPPELLSRQFDVWMYRQVVYHKWHPRKAIPPDLMGTVERRLKAVGQTKEPEKAAGVGDGEAARISAVVREAMEGDARRAGLAPTPPEQTEAARPGASERGRD